MASVDESVVSALKKMVSAFGNTNFAVGRIKRGTINEQKGICEIIPSEGSAKITRAFFNVVTDASFLLIPAEGSHVLYMTARNFRNQAYIVACSKIKKLLLKTSPAGSLTIDMSDSGAELKVGANGRIKIAAAGTEIGTSGQPQVRGTALQSWAQNVDTAIAALIAWGATGQAPGPTGGIAPLAGVTPTTFAPTILSSKNKVE